jgi:outer membrane protein OmpA-like peptidoglycan-associated protein
VNTIIDSTKRFPTTLIAAAVASILLAACATMPVEPPGAAEARAKLTALQSDPQLASRAPAAIKDAELAVRAAEEPQADPALAKYRVYIADRSVDIATAKAETALAEDRRKALVQSGDQARLDARTREADAANNQLLNARAVMAEQQNQTDAARSQADAARSQADAALLSAADLQRQLDDLHAKQTERGMVLTLGDTLFTSGKSDLKVGATTNLDKLVAFLNAYPNREVLIEGYTDNIGGDDYNLDLSQRRADAVKSYLVHRGISSQRLSATGRGKSDPVADNSSADGRQQNRRVNVTIENPPVALL